MKKQVSVILALILALLTVLPLVSCSRPKGSAYADQLNDGVYSNTVLHLRFTPPAAWSMTSGASHLSYEVTVGGLPGGLSGDASGDASGNPFVIGGPSVVISGGDGIPVSGGQYVIGDGSAGYSFEVGSGGAVVVLPDGSDEVSTGESAGVISGYISVVPGIPAGSVADALPSDLYDYYSSYDASAMNPFEMIAQSGTVAFTATDVQTGDKASLSHTEVPLSMTVKQYIMLLQDNFNQISADPTYAQQTMDEETGTARLGGCVFTTWHTVQALRVPTPTEADTQAEPTETDTGNPKNKTAERKLVPVYYYFCKKGTTLTTVSFYDLSGKGAEWFEGLFSKTE